MPAETVHVAECLGGKPTVGLHVYGGDIMGEVPRHMWIRKLSRNTRSTGIRTRPSRRPHRKRPRHHS